MVRRSMLSYRSSMKKILSKIKTFLAKFNFPEWTVPVILFGLCVASYAIFIPWLKYYWDDNGMIWMYKTYGAQGLLTYDSVKRPLRGVLYTWLFPIMGTKPLTWHLFMLVARWGVSVLLWLLIRNIWPERRKMALFAALAFAVYPGFDQQGIAVIYSVFMLVLAFLFLSFYLNILALRKDRKWFYPLMIGSLFFAVLNISLLEYFYTLELLRPFLIFFLLQKKQKNRKENIKKTLVYSAPFLIVLFAITIYRTFFFEAQTESYDLTLIQSLRENFLATLGNLSLSVVLDIFTATVRAWWKALSHGISMDLSKLMLTRYGILSAAGAIGTGVFIRFFHWQNKAVSKRQENWQVILFSAAAIILGGIPFWLTGLSVSVDFPNSRFTLSYLLGVCLLFGFVFDRFSRWKIPSTVFLSSLIGLSVGMHFLVGYQLRLEGEAHESVMQQLSVRIPSLEPNTILMTNYIAGSFNSDNSLIGPLNYLYEDSPGDGKLEYLWVYPNARLGNDLSRIESGLDYDYDFIVADFHGNTSQTIVIYKQPGSCIRVLDPELDPKNLILEEYMREAAALSNWNVIDLVGTPNALPEEIYAGSYDDDWCKVYQQAGVLFQQEAWNQVLDLYDEAIMKGYTPKHPDEYRIFIQSYAHLGDWEGAISLTQQVFDRSPDYQYGLCNVWEYFRTSDTFGREKEPYVTEMMDGLLQCQSITTP